MVAPQPFPRGRIPSSCAVLALVAGACTGTIEPGLIDVGGAPADDPAGRAQAAFDDEVVPLLETSCSSCHAGAVPQGTPAFLLPNPDVRSTVLAWPSLVLLDAPPDSLLLRKGAHEGRAWTPSESGVIQSWIDLEGAAAGLSPRRPDPDPNEDDDATPSTPASPLVEGLNELDLGEAGLPGTTLSFRVDLLAAGVYLTELEVTAGPEGAHLVHPTFVPWVGGAPHPELAQPLDDVDLMLEAGVVAAVGTGALVLPNVPRDAGLAVEFEVAETLAALPGDDAGLGPCAAVRSFTERLRPELADRCESCHAGDDDDATDAVDMTRLDDLSVDGQTFTCTQIAARVRVDEPGASALLAVVDPASASLHPYRFAGHVEDFVAFSAALLAWIDEAAAAAEEP